MTLPLRQDAAGQLKPAKMPAIFGLTLDGERRPIIVPFSALALKPFCRKQVERHVAKDYEAGILAERYPMLYAPNMFQRINERGLWLRHKYPDARLFEVRWEFSVDFGLYVLMFRPVVGKIVYRPPDLEF